MKQKQMKQSRNIVALSGGVGGAKLALGLSKVLAPDELTIVTNTGDDFCHMGFPVSPDLDTVMYTLAGLNNTELGWGLKNESWQFMDALEVLGGETWFRLGDRDIATHTYRREKIAAGLNLQQLTEQLCLALNVQHRLIPMSNDSVATQVFDGSDWLDFQDYFVRRQCAPTVTGIRFNGIEQAALSEGFEQALAAVSEIESDTGNALKAVLICPSNPFVSVDPILKLPTVLPKLKQCSAPVIAVSPIVNGQAIKGPTAKMMAALDMPVSALGVANYYRDIIDGLVIDHADADAVSEIEALGIRVKMANSIMISEQDKIALANDCISFAEQF